MEAARDDAETQLEQRRVELPNTEEITRYVADFRDFLQEGTIPERKALIHNFVEGIEVVGDEVTLTYTVPMPSDGATSESASVLDFVKLGPPYVYRRHATRTLTTSRTTSAATTRPRARANRLVLSCAARSLGGVFVPSLVIRSNSFFNSLDSFALR